MLPRTHKRKKKKRSTENVGEKRKHSTPVHSRGKSPTGFHKGA